MRKYKILSFTHHHVVPNQIECLFSLKTKWLRLRLPHFKGKRCKSIINVVRNTFMRGNKVHYFYDAFELLLQKNKSPAGLEWHEGEEMMTESFSFIGLPSFKADFAVFCLQHCAEQTIVSSSFRVCWQRLDFCVHGCSVAVNRPVVNVNRWWRLRFCLLVWKRRT